ncbi:MAG: HNH endonuclease [Halobacteriovoraceae bacterium]|nr:HNH endonuclease [Halobacteriovoraceae bacterium]
MRTLLLDNSFFPIKVISWQKAMILLLTSRAEIVDEYSDFTVRSPRKHFNVPKILRLYSKHQGPKKIKFNRLNVYLRDDFSCQYCTLKFDYNDLTFDHVLPQSRGGKTSWINIVTCCKLCNLRKGNKTPREANMKLKRLPHEPQWSARLVIKMLDDDPEEWFYWLPQSTIVA